ncbi:MAG: hypothetical protein AAF183_11030 [Pseudomonadota bacterium]
MAHDMKKTAQIVTDSNKKAFKEGQDHAKKTVDFLKKAESPEEIQEIMKRIEDLKKKMSAQFDSQLRVLKVALAQLQKEKK